MSSQKSALLSDRQQCKSEGKPRIAIICESIMHNEVTGFRMRFCVGEKKSGISNFPSPCSLLVHEGAHEWLEHGWRPPVTQITAENIGRKNVFMPAVTETFALCSTMTSYMRSEKAPDHPQVFQDRQARLALDGDLASTIRRRLHSSLPTARYL